MYGRLFDHFTPSFRQEFSSPVYAIVIKKVKEKWLRKKSGRQGQPTASLPPRGGYRKAFAQEVARG